MSKLKLLVNPWLRLSIGSYVGDGRAERKIDGLPFKPVYLTIFRVNPGVDVPNPTYADSHICTRIEGMAEGLAHSEDSAGRYHTGRILRFEADGFVIGDLNADYAPNKLGETYVYIAFGKPRVSLLTGE